MIGTLVDSVSDVLALAADDIKPAPEVNSSVDAGYFLGIGCVKAGEARRMLMFADIEP